MKKANNQKKPGEIKVAVPDALKYLNSIFDPNKKKAARVKTVAV